MADAGLAIVGEMQSKARPAATRTRVDWQSGDPDLLVRARRSGAILAIHADGIVKLAAARDLVCALPGYRPAVQHPLVTLARTVTDAFADSARGLLVGSGRAFLHLGNDLCGGFGTHRMPGDLLVALDAAFESLEHPVFRDRNDC
jgi:hypothetical protein